MLNIKYVAFLLVIFSLTTIKAQPVITEANAPIVGDIAPYWIDTLPDQSFNLSTGANIQWTIQNFDNDLIDTIRYVDVVSTGFDTSAVVASCDYAIELANSTYIFVKKVRGSVNAEVSLAISGRNPNNGQVFLATALDPDTLALFPITYPKVFIDTGVFRTYYDTVILGTPQKIPVDITMVHFDSVDAYGTITLPSGNTFNVVRIKRHLKVSIEASFAGFPIFADSFKSLELHFVTDDPSYHYAIASASLSTSTPDSLTSFSVLADFVLSAPNMKRQRPAFVVFRNEKGIEILANQIIYTEAFDMTGKFLIAQEGRKIFLPINHNGVIIVKIFDEQGNFQILRL